MATSMVVGSAVVASAYETGSTSVTVVPVTADVSGTPVTVVLPGVVQQTARKFIGDFNLAWTPVDFAAELATAYKAQPEYFRIIVDYVNGRIRAIDPSVVVRDVDVAEFHAYLEHAATMALNFDDFSAYHDDRLRVLQGGNKYVAIYRAERYTDIARDAYGVPVWYELRNSEQRYTDGFNDYNVPEHYILATSANAKDWTVVGSFYDRVYTGLGLSSNALVYVNGHFFIGANRYMKDSEQPYLLRSADGLTWYKAAVPFAFEILDPERKLDGALGLDGTGDLHIVSIGDRDDLYDYPTYATYSPVNPGVGMNTFTNWHWTTTTEEAYIKLKNDHLYKYGDANGIITGQISSQLTYNDNSINLTNFFLFSDDIIEISGGRYVLDSDYRATWFDYTFEDVEHWYPVSNQTRESFFDDVTTIYDFVDLHGLYDAAMLNLVRVYMPEAVDIYNVGGSNEKAPHVHEWPMGY